MEGRKKEGRKHSLKTMSPSLRQHPNKSFGLRVASFLNIHSEGRSWSPGGMWKTKADPDHSPASVDARGGVGILTIPVFLKQIIIGSDLYQRLFPLVSENTHGHPCRLMHTNYAQAGSGREAAAGSSGL